jgi:hypothetical protein
MQVAGVAAYPASVCVQHVVCMCGMGRRWSDSGVDCCLTCAACKQGADEAAFLAACVCVRHVVCMC